MTHAARPYTATNCRERELTLDHIHTFLTTQGHGGYLRDNMNTKDPGGPVVIILASGSDVGGFDPGRGRWIFSERKNPEYDFLRKGSKAVGPVS